MAYNPYPYGGYQPGYYPMVFDQFDQLRRSQMQPQPSAVNGIIWCQGEEGAKAYMTPPGTSAMLMDSEKNIFYIKSSDQSGMPLPLRIFDYTERTPGAQTSAQTASLSDVEYVPREEFTALQMEFKDLEKRITGMSAQKSKKSEKPVAKEESVNV